MLQGTFQRLTNITFICLFLKEKNPRYLTTKVFPCVQIIENLEENGHSSKMCVLLEHVW